MTEKGTILLPAFYDKEQSYPVEIGDFFWTSLGSDICSLRPLENGRYCQIIGCHTKELNRTVLWSCSAVGTFAYTNTTNDKQSTFHFWNALFGNGHSLFHVHPQKSVLKKAVSTVYSTPGGLGERKIHVEIVDSFYADLSEPRNALITNPEDAVMLKIDGEKLWIPKIGLSHHSPFFNTLFNGDFREKAENSYDLKDINLEDFLRFLGIVYCLKMPIDENSVEGLLKLGDFFQCKLVLDRCEEYLKNAPVKRLTHLKKLKLVERFKLQSTLTDTINKMTLQEAKTVFVDLEKFEFCRHLMFLKLCLMDP